MKIKIDKKLNKKILSLYGLKNNKEKLENKFDLFITCSGFEKRTLGLIKQFPQNIEIEHIRIFLYNPK